MTRWLLSLLSLLLAASASFAAENYQVTFEHDVKIPMRDGFILHADIYRPQADGKFPVLLQRTPYDRRQEFGFGLQGAQRGFVVIVEDVRGRYASEGKFYTFVNEPLAKHYGIPGVTGQQMRRDPRVIVLGEDVGRFGGVFRATSGLQEEFGADRCIDTPLAESGIIGAAIGMAMYGMRPVPEIQFADFIYPAYDQIVNELAKFRYRSGGQYPCPVVIRTPYGGGIRGGHYHSQSPEA